MQISKYLHSCLFIEEQGKTILFDPGMFTFNEQALEIDKLDKLDYLLITHEHADHFHLPLIKALLQKFPEVKIITNHSIVSLLKQETITASSEENEIVKLENAPHERLWDSEPPENVAISIFDKLTHVGDSMHFTRSCDILALPMTAPWGSTNEAVNKALEIKPKVIIPIHDFMWKDEIRVGMYQRLKEFFATKNIDFKPLATREVIEV